MTATDRPPQGFSPTRAPPPDNGLKALRPHSVDDIRYGRVLPDGRMARFAERSCASSATPPTKQRINPGTLLVCAR